MALAAMQVRWSVMRDNSLTSTRMYWQRSGVSTSKSFSTASTKATLLMSGDT